MAPKLLMSGMQKKKKKSRISSLRQKKTYLPTISLWNPPAFLAESNDEVVLFYRGDSVRVFNKKKRLTKLDEEREEKRKEKLLFFVARGKTCR